MSFLILYVFLVATFTFISHHFFIANFEELESNKNQKDLTIFLEKIAFKMNDQKKSNNVNYWKDTISLIQAQNKVFKEANIIIKENQENTITHENNKKIGLYNILITTDKEESYLTNNISFYDQSGDYIFTLNLKNSMEILESGKNTIFLYNIAVAILLLIIFLTLRQIQNGLSEHNLKLEEQVEERTKKLNEYVNIVNKYVTTSSTDLEGNITDVSEAFSRICGYSKEELLGRNHRIVKHPDTDPSVYADLWETITQDKKWVGEIKNQKKNGDAYWVLANIDPIYSNDGKKIGYTSIRQEITDKKRVEKLSVTDKLTQLYNRVRLEEIFNVEIAKFHRYNTKFSMILIDIDHFKDVNDTHGHNVGDSLLQEIAKVLRSSVRIEDVVGRWGGEEFIVLSNNYTVEGVMQLAEKIRKNIESYDFKTVGKKTASFGVAILNKEDTQESLIYRADKSLYHAKKTGRNKVCLH
jgi:diguanylate cyclase (GGDEF)-like protein/PAS domain S-box-containing protein